MMTTHGIMRACHLLGQFSNGLARILVNGLIQSLFSELYKALGTQRVCEFELPLLQAWEPFLSSPFCICALSIHSSNVAMNSLVSLEAWLKAKKGGCCTCLFFFTLHSIVISLKKGKIQTSKNINKPGKEK